MKILILEDSPTFQKILAEELSDPDYELSFVDSGAKAILAIENSNTFDLLISDIELPGGMNGLETYKVIKEKNLDENALCPVVFATSNESIEFRKIGFELGATDFIYKSFEKGEFKLVIDKLLKPSNLYQGLTILVAEDSKMARKIITRNLEREGFNLILANDGEEALDAYLKNKDKIDMVITDNFMPKLKGTELIEKIRKEHGDKVIPIIVLTAADDMNSIVTFFRVGANDYIVKPYVKEEFISRIKSHLESYSLKKQLKQSIEEQKHLSELKDDFLSICSHDLRSPLNVILGYAELLAESEKIKDEDKEYVSSIEKSSIFLLDLINDLLDLRKIESKFEIETCPVSLELLLKDVVKNMSKVAMNKDVSIEFINNLKEHSLTTLGDQVSLIRAINNLISNSIKFSPEGKKVYVTLDSIASEFSIEVKDEGIGICEDRIGNVFTKFTKESQAGTSGEKGTGLGLAITKEIIKKHAGKITVYSDGENRGTTFTIYLKINL